ncbi:unnamed protein product, partial [Effrenium voratum]
MASTLGAGALVSPLPSRWPADRGLVLHREAYHLRCDRRTHLRRCRLQEADAVVKEGVAPLRFSQLRRGQKVAAGAALLAALAGLVHLVIRAMSGDTRPWFRRSRRRNAEALVALSSFLSAHPIEYPGLLWASSAATGACEAASRVGCSRNYRTLCTAPER